MSESDSILLKGVQVPTFVGVPDEERERAQTVTVNLAVVPTASMKGLGDSIEGTINYAELADCLFVVAADRPRKLIETLAEDMAAAIFARFQVEELSIEIEKQILPGMRAAAVHLHFTSDDF